jgi:hypothetical protein
MRKVLAPASKNMTPHASLPHRRFFSNLAFHFMLFEAGLVILLGAIALTLPPEAYAAVGSGGSGGGGGGGHQSRYGYGWHKYSVSGGGPADGFRDGTHWSSVQNACNDDGANLAIVFVIRDSDGSAMGYDWNGWSGSDYTTAGNFISISTMKDYWADLPLSQRNAHGSASTPANNVGWFCYSSTNYSINPLTTVTTGYSPTIPKGSDVTFTNQLKNNGPDDKTVNDGFWRVFTFIVPAGQALPTGPRNSSVNVDSTSEINAVYYGGANIAKNYQWIGSSSNDGSCATYDATMKLDDNAIRTSCITNERTTSSSYDLNNGDRICAAMLVSLYKPYVNDRRYSAPACVTVTVASNVLSCSVGGFIGTSLLVNSSQKFTVSATGSAGPPNKIVTMISGPGYSNTFTDTSPAQNGTTATSTMSFVTSSTPGTYTLSWYAYDSSGLSVGPCPGISVQAGYRPYFEISGGDLIAGTQSDVSPNFAKILAWNGGSGDYRGANSSLALIATGTIDGAMSGKQSSNSVLNRLSFANTAGTGSYGGSFNPNTLPALEYTPPTTTKLLGAGSYNVATLAGSYKANGNITLFGQLTGGSKVTIDASAYDVLIGGNILYSYNSVVSIPHLSVYAQNIYVIDKSISEMHGTFHATNKFSTCGNIQPSDLSNPVVYNACNGQLKVYGAVSAGQLLLVRTHGSWNDNVKGPAEQFIQGPEAWLNGDATDNFDHYVSLPPIL